MKTAGKAPFLHESQRIDPKNVLLLIPAETRRPGNTFRNPPAETGSLRNTFRTPPTETGKAENHVPHLFGQAGKAENPVPQASDRAEKAAEHVPQPSHLKRAGAIGFGRHGYLYEYEKVARASAIRVDELRGKARARVFSERLAPGPGPHDRPAPRHHHGRNPFRAAPGFFPPFPITGFTH